MKTNDEIIDSFLLWLNAGHSKATVQSYSDALRSFRKWLYATGKEIRSLRLKDVTLYSQSLENRGIKSSTRFHYMTALRSLWRWLEKQDLTTFTASLIPMPKYEKDRRDALEPDEFRRIMDSFDENFPKQLRNKLIVAMLFMSGMRLGELLSIDVSNLDLPRMCVTIRTFKRKNHKREVYWDMETNRLLLRWLAIRESVIAEAGLGSEALFVSLDKQTLGERIGRCVVQRIFRERRSKLGISKKISPHSCRHGFATLGVKSNINLPFLQEMLGHANIRNTMIYTHLTRDDIREEYRRVYNRLTEPLGFDSLPTYAGSREDQTQSRNVQVQKNGRLLPKTRQDVWREGEHRVRHY